MNYLHLLYGLVIFLLIYIYHKFNYLSDKTHYSFQHYLKDNMSDNIIDKFIKSILQIIDFICGISLIAGIAYTGYIISQIILNYIFNQ